VNNLTGRECLYLGARCHWRDPETKERSCWNPITHRVQRGPYSWWFTCFDHTEAVAVAYHGDPNDGRGNPKPQRGPE
jgi:hypothetical protein